jgi:hypothetical protein
MQFKFKEMHMYNKKIIFLLFVCLTSINVWAADITHRTTEFTNDKVNVWQTIIYPSKGQQLKPHRHDYDRVVIALDDGKLKIVNDKGQEHDLVLKKNKSYYLTKDVPNELHTDENVSGHPLGVIVIELKY